MSFSPEHLGTDVRRRLERAFCASVGVVTTVGLMLPMGVAHAETVQTLVNYLQYGIAQVLYWISQGVAYFVLLLVDALIKVAQYNNFDVLPVQTGWPLVRDIVNMFFIVVLLVTAFSTIIGYSKFEYKKILPKLLLMAVLVNFSKQLIGLLIDFSQILMLTFVNGFKAAAAGNFVTALKLNDIMKLAQTDQANGLGEKDPMLLQILLSLMLAVFFLGITAITLLIMIVYLIVRVVGLWIALIFSPAALFATALPEAMGKGLSAFMGKYWTRLGAMLTGGPIMAFFLWLTLATVQSAGIDKLFTAEAQSRQAEQAQAIGYFSSAVGNTEAVTTFLVAIIMLLTGLDAAVSIAGEVSKGLGDAAGAIRKQGMRATRFAAYGGILAGGAYASRQVGRAGSAAGRYGFQKSGLEKATGVGLQRLGLATGIDQLAIAGGKLRTAPIRRRQEAEKGLKTTLVGMSKKERRAQLKSYASGGLTVSDAEQRAANLELAKYEISSEGEKELHGEFMQEAATRGFKGTEQKAYAELATRQAIDKRLTQIESIAKEEENEDEVKKIKEKREKNPDQIFNDEDYQKEISKLLGKDPREFMRTVSAAAFEDSRTIDSIFHGTNLLKEDGTLDEDSAWYNSVVKPGGKQAKLIKQRAAEIRAAIPAGSTASAVLGSAVLPNVMYTKDKRGDWHAVDRGILLESMKEPVDTVHPRPSAGIARIEPDIRTSQQTLQGLRSGPAAVPPRATVRAAQRQGMEAGARLDEVYKVDGSGRFVGWGANDVDKAANAANERLNFSENVQHLTTTGAATPAIYEHLNFTALDKNKGAKNEARSIFAGSADLPSMKTAWQTAAAAHNETARRVITDAVRITHDEGSRIEDMISSHNQLHPARPINVANVVAAAAAHNVAALNTETADMDVKIEMNEAEALMKKRQIDADPLLSTFREHASRRARVSAVRGGYPAPTPVIPPTPDDEV